MTTIYQSQPHCLNEEYLQPGEKKDLRHAWGLTEDKNLFAHVVYNFQTFELLYYKACSDDFRAELPRASFIEGWLKIEPQHIHKQRMYKTTYALPKSRAPKKMALPKNLEELLAPTNGYLLYQEQMTALLKLVRQAPPHLIPMYIRNWNLKKPGTRLMASTVHIQGINLDDLIEDRIYDTENKFLYA